MINNKIIGSKPELEYFKSSYNINMVRIPYEITKLSEGVYSWKEIIVKYSNFNYGGIVSAIINMVYSNDKMTAIINNYLLDANEESTKEFNEMQEFRSYAKSTAKIITDMYNIQ